MDYSLLLAIETYDEQEDSYEFYNADTMLKESESRLITSNEGSKNSINSDSRPPLI